MAVVGQFEYGADVLFISSKSCLVREAGCLYSSAAEKKSSRKPAQPRSYCTRIYRTGAIDELPLMVILGNWASGVRGSFNTTTCCYTPLGRFRLRHALRSSLKLATKAIKKMIAGTAKNMMASKGESTVKLM